MVINSTLTLNNFSSGIKNDAANSDAAGNVIGAGVPKNDGALTPLLQPTTANQPTLSLITTSSATSNNDVKREQPPVQPQDSASESVRVSSSIGRAASAGQLSREQALEIYRNIARFL